MYTAKGGEDCLFPFNLWGFGGFRAGEGGGGEFGPKKRAVHIYGQGARRKPGLKPLVFFISLSCAPIRDFFFR